jgi:tRNA(Ile)-lysidine synthetase-like protein
MGEACGQVEQGEFLMERSKGRIIALFRSNFTAAAPSVTLSRPGTVGFREWTLAVQTLPSPSTPKFDDRSRVFLDAHAVSGELQVRGLTDGDCYQPCRYAGHKKLADLFADSGVPASLRRDIPIVADEAGILWPVGFPVADRARLGPGTETVIEITAVCA